MPPSDCDAPRPRVLALLGPTAAGKSRLALELARVMPVELVSVDSMQVYRGMDVGTAKPTPEERLRVPHHLLDLVDPEHDFTVAEYQGLARRAVEEIWGRGRIPLLVGGSGLYFEAVVFDLRFPPRGDPEIRRELEEELRHDPEAFFRRLAKVDPLFAIREDFRNPRRALRAMEVYRVTGRPFTSFVRKRGSYPLLIPYAGAVINPPRGLLYRLVDQRVDRMMEEGLLEEARGLLRGGRLSRTARQALGYKELFDFLEGRCSLEEAVARIKKATRRYARRQVIYLRGIPGLRWFSPREEDYGVGWPDLVREIGNFLREAWEGEGGAGGSTPGSEGR